MERLSKTIITALFLVIFSGAAFGASLGLDVDSIYFNADEKADVMGAGTSRSADGRTDASFSLGVSGAQAITEISLRNETTGRMWSTSPSNSVQLLLVKNSGGNILNPSNRLPITPVLMGADFRLYINDAEGSIPTDADFTVIVRLIDDQEVTGKTRVNGLGHTYPYASSTDGISAFEINGADGNNYRHFTLDLNFNNVNVRAIKISGQNYSTNIMWDTVERNNVPALKVIDSGNNIMNRRDGTVDFTVRGTQRYALLAYDKDGILADRSAKAKIIISLSDGRTFEREASISNSTAFRDTLSVEYKGTGRYDFTGQDEKMESNARADRQIDAVLQTSGTIAGVRVRSASSGWVWDTIPGNGKYLVVLTDDKGRRQNNSDGTVNMRVNGSTALSLWFDGDNTKKDGPYTVTFVMSDGQVLEASTGDAPAAATVTKADRSVIFTSAKPALVNLDHVGKNKKRAANGYKDTALNIKITGKGNIKALALTFDSGKGWDTLAENNGRWLLGVRESNKILNHNNGAIRIPVNGTKTYQLLMQDNGDLRKRNGVVHISVTWADGQVTKSYLKW